MYCQAHNIHIPYYPQAAGLIERINGLLNEQVRKLGGGILRRWKENLQEAVQILNNRPIGESETPPLMITTELQIHAFSTTETVKSYTRSCRFRSSSSKGV